MSFWRAEVIKLIARLKELQPLNANLTTWAAITRAAGLDTFAGAPSSANLRSLLTDETGTGAAVFAGAPTITGNPVFSGIPSLTGGALSFPATQVPSSDANTLDDYEEGTFTPTIVGTTIAGAGTYITQSGSYTKIGNRVFFEIDINWSAHTGTGNITLAGLAFAAGIATAFTVYWESLTYAATPTAVMGAAQSSITFRANASAGGATPLAMDAAARFVISGNYRV